jgi:predicted  nucleic acid-binding Zn-ribbon protein
MGTALINPETIAPGLAYSPADDSVAIDVFLGGARKAALRGKYGWGTGLPKLDQEGCPTEQSSRADALRAVGLEKRGARAEICGRVAELFECPKCFRPFKRAWSCMLRSCPHCGKKIFDRAFSELLPLESHIPSSLASVPGWNWKILDFTFRHDGEFPSREEMRKMRRVVNRVVDRAVREKRRDIYEAAKGCRLRFDGGLPVMFEGWPIASAPDGSARVLTGWVAVQVGKVENRPMCVSCGSRVKKIKRQHERLCPKCGPVAWPDWEKREVDGRRWRLRFGILHVAVSEFGYSKETGGPNSNYHFHTCFFGPYMEQERLVELFRKESAKAFGAESRGVWIETAKKGYRSVLAHALKYTAKLPATTPEGLAAYEKVLVGVRRYAVRGFLQGVCFEEEKRNKPKCPECRESLQRISGLGIVPLSEVADIPFLAEEKSQYEDTRKDDEFCFLQSEEMASHAPRAPC